MRLILLGYAVLVMWGCASTTALNSLYPGMQKPIAVAMVGEPDLTEYSEGKETLIYYLRTDALPFIFSYANPKRAYHIDLVNGKVTSWGRVERCDAVPEARVSKQESSEPSGRSNQGGMNLLCKDAISRQDSGGIFVHCN